MSPSSSSFSHLCVVHHHLRAGGVRRIIELALPQLVKKSPVRRVTLAVGEISDARWIDSLKDCIDVPLEVVCVPGFRYLSECGPGGPALRRRIERALRRLAPVPAETLFWVHNPGLARNLFLTDELRKLAAGSHARVVFHHHDFWFENRWSRWSSLRKAGFRTVDAVGESIFGEGASIVHAAINRSDAAFLQERNSGAWMPNLTTRQKPCSADERKGARRWLTERLGSDGPVWLFPTRFLRRKNLAEAVLVTRWLRPDGWLVTTAGVSSPEEAAYARRLEGAAQRGAWRVRFRMLEHEDGRAPAIPALLAASEAVVMTSAQEGFGLPYLEAAAARRPLIARRLPNVVPDLESFGFRFPWLYDEIWVDPALLNEKKERERQTVAWRTWRDTIPGALRKIAGKPLVLKQPSGGPFPFSRLTLAGQLEILSHPADDAWKHCEPWNPELAAWKNQAAVGRLAVPVWPPGADDWIGGAAYAKRFWEAARKDSAPSTAGECHAIQRNFILERLGSEYLYPILFSGK